MTIPIEVPLRPACHVEVLHDDFERVDAVRCADELPPVIAPGAYRPYEPDYSGNTAFAALWEAYTALFDDEAFGTIEWVASQKDSLIRAHMERLLAALPPGLLGDGEDFALPFVCTSMFGNSKWNPTRKVWDEIPADPDGLFVAEVDWTGGPSDFGRFWIGFERA